MAQCSGICSLSFSHTHTHVQSYADPFFLHWYFNENRQSYKIHFQPTDIKYTVSVELLLLFVIELTFCKWAKIQFIFYNRIYIGREGKVDRAAKCNMNSFGSIQSGSEGWERWIRTNWHSMDSKMVYQCVETTECGMFHNNQPVIRWIIEWSCRWYSMNINKNTSNIPKITGKLIKFTLILMHFNE